MLTMLYSSIDYIIIAMLFTFASPGQQHLFPLGKDFSGAATEVCMSVILLESIRVAD